MLAVELLDEFAAAAAANSCNCSSMNADSLAALRGTDRDPAIKGRRVEANETCPNASRERFTVESSSPGKSARKPIAAKPSSPAAINE